MDDATGRLMHLRFCDSENAFDYMMATRQYIDKHGKPVAFYSDKHAVFRVSGPKADVPAQPSSDGLSGNWRSN
jgi:hypothetical protein